MRVATPSRIHRTAAVAALVGVAGLHARPARAEEQRSTEVVYLADGACPDESAFRAYMENVGVAASADVGAPRRFFTVLMHDHRAHAASGAPRSFAGELLWVDGTGKTASRAIAGDTCEGVARALALLVAFVLDTPPRTAVVDERPDPTSASPDDGARSAPSGPVAPVAQGGGLTVARFAGFGGGQRSAGIRVLAASDTGGAIVGGALSLQSDAIDSVDGYGANTVGSGYEGRAGVFSAWGAPWDDSIAGFMLEAGVTAGSSRGSVIHTDLSRPFGATHTTPMATQFLNPYAAVSLLFQIPLDWRVRPFAGTSISWTPGFYLGSTFEVDGQVGLRWCAW